MVRDEASPSRIAFSPAEHDGRPVCSLLVQQRIEQAAGGLSGGDRAVAEVADVAGRRRRVGVSDVPGDVREVEAFRE